MADPTPHEVLSALAAGISALKTHHRAALALLGSAYHLIFGDS